MKRRAYVILMNMKRWCRFLRHSLYELIANTLSTLAIIGLILAVITVSLAVFYLAGCVILIQMPELGDTDDAIALGMLFLVLPIMIGYGVIRGGVGTWRWVFQMWEETENEKQGATDRPIIEQKP